MNKKFEDDFCLFPVRQEFILPLKKKQIGLMYQHLKKCTIFDRQS